MKMATIKTSYNRRSFLKTSALAGGGMILGFSWLASCQTKVDEAVLTMPEEWFDINAYLKHLRAEQLGVDDISLALAPGRIHLRANELLGPWQIGSYQLGLRLTRDVELVPEGGSVRVTAARIGHMPLPGPLSRVAGNYFQALFDGEREMLVLDRLTELEADTGRVMVVVGR